MPASAMRFHALASILASTAAALYSQPRCGFDISLSDYGAFSEKLDSSFADLKRSLADDRATAIIDTWFHIWDHPSPAVPAAGTHWIDDTVIEDQVVALNKGFATAGFGFRLAGIERYGNDSLDWSRFPLAVCSPNAFQGVRRGNYSTLNVYTAPLVSSALAHLLGYVTALPPTGGTMIGSQVCADGVFLSPFAFPGGLHERISNENAGSVLVHEAGHWLGLNHPFLEDYTFNGKPCARDADWVADTPSLARPSQSCEWEYFCNGTWRFIDEEMEDNTRNIMDYAHGPCPKIFTKGQINKMQQTWALSRGQDYEGSVGMPVSSIEHDTDKSNYTGLRAPAHGASPKSHDAGTEQFAQAALRDPGQGIRALPKAHVRKRTGRLLF